MQSTPDPSTGHQTHFAPAERAEPEQLRIDRDRVLQRSPASALLEDFPDLLMVLNRERQVVAASSRLLETLGQDSIETVLGLRPGELVDCVHAHECPGGCGTSESCSVCGAVEAILECLATRAPVTRECRIVTDRQADGGALDLLVQAEFLEISQADYVLLVLRDISAQKRRAVLERAFFHDVLNIAGGLLALVELLAMDEEASAAGEYRQDLERLASGIVDEITAHRELMAAESGDLQPDPRSVPVAEVVRSVVEMYRHHPTAEGRQILLLPPAEADIVTDPTLLRRVLGNLLKNALEATDEGGAVTIGAEVDKDRVVFRVSNPAVMPRDVQAQVFQRSFSTKGGTGRGIGTHSVKLLTESYLGGRVSFMSREPEGTVFIVALPRAAGPSPQ